MILDPAFLEYIERAVRKPTAPRWQWLGFQRAVRDLMPHLRVRAQQAREHADSYRKFNVGAAVLAYRRDYDHILHPNYGECYKIFEGWNITRFKGDPGKVCAEAMALSAAVSAGYSLVLAIVISGPVQADDATRVSSDTLQPCASCRALLKGAIVRNKTVIVTATPDEKVIEFQTRRELLTRFSSPSP